jgi:hypothetical protein
MTTFEEWLIRCGLREQVEGMHVIAAFEVMVARLDGARAAGAKDPMRAISTRAAGPHSRLATHRMLEQLGYSPAQRRIMHRLLAGSPSGWPGLLRLFASSAQLSSNQRRYIARQVCDFRRAARPAELRVAEIQPA